MRRALPLLILLGLLLSACGVDATATVAPAPTSTVPAVSESLRAAANLDGLSFRRSNLPRNDNPALVLGSAPASANEAGAAPGAVFSLIPQLTNPSLSVSLPAASPRLSAAVATGWTVIVDDDFSNPNSDIWNDTELSGGSVSRSAGDLAVKANEGWLINSAPTPASSVSDGYIAATFTIDGSGSAGVMARSGTDSGGLKVYVCWADNGGNFGCNKRLGGNWSLISSGTNDGFNPDDANTLKLQAVGSELVFSINDEEVARFSDKSMSRGSWGVFAQSDEGATVGHFSHVQVAKAAPAASPTTTPVLNLTPAATPTRLIGRATRTPQPPTSSPTATITPSPTATPQGAISDEQFEGDDAGTWPINPSGDGYTILTADGDYVMNMDTPDSMLIAYPKEAKTLTNASIEADVKLDGSGNAGLMVRYQKASNGAWSLYFCYINNDGLFGCAKEIKDNLTIITDGVDDTIKSGEYNNLKLSIDGDELSFQINDGEVISFSDDDLTSGSFGAVIESEAEPVVARYDRITISK